MEETQKRQNNLEKEVQSWNLQFPISKLTTKPQLARPALTET